MWVEKVMEYKIPLYLLGVIFVVGILGNIIAQIALRRMIREAENIHSSNYGLIKLIKAKFEHANMRSSGVKNVEAFVDKYMYEYRMLGVRFLTWQFIELKCLWVSVAVGILGVAFQYLNSGMDEMVFQYAAWTGISGVVLFLFHVLFGSERKVEAIRTYIVEYLENVYVCRYAKIEPEEERKVEPEEMTKEVKEAVMEEQKEQVEGDMSREMRIREILEEFLA